MVDGGPGPDDAPPDLGGRFGCWSGGRSDGNNYSVKVWGGGTTKPNG